MRAAAAIAAALCLLVPLAAPAASGAATVGAPLSLTPNVPGDEGCEAVVFPPELRQIVGIPPSCTFFGLDISGAWTSQTPSGSWVIKKARVRTGPRVGPMAFTVVRALRSQAGSPPAGIICCTMPAESQVFTPAPNSINEIGVNIPVVNTVENIDGEPVEVVDYLGISVLSLGSSLPVHVAGGAEPGASSTTSFFAPAARAGQERLSDGSFGGVTPLINADYEPAGSGAGGGGGGGAGGPGGFALLPGTKLVKGGTGARLGALVPGPGLLRAGPAANGAARVSVAARSRKKRKPKLVGAARRRVKAAGKAYVTVRLTRAGKALLKRRGKLKLRIRVSFKPDGGKATAQTRRVTFKRPTR